MLRTLFIAIQLGLSLTAWADPLDQIGLRAEFVEGLRQQYEPAPREQVLELNTLLFLKRSDYHGVQVTPEAVQAVATFVSTHAPEFKMAEDRFSVEPGAISSLLWLESRHGSNEGKFHVASVFMDLLDADSPANLKHLKSAAHRFRRHLSRAALRGIVARAHKRRLWAKQELFSLQTMWEKNPDAVLKLRGSFAGAFGMPQFEPSSYVTFAQSALPPSPPDLLKPADAILSVAFYLHQSHWGKTPKRRLRALLKYNNSHDYARAILKLSRLSSRAPAS